MADSIILELNIAGAGLEFNKLIECFRNEPYNNEMVYD